MCYPQKIFQLLFSRLSCQHWKTITLVSRRLSKRAQATSRSGKDSCTIIRLEKKKNWKNNCKVEKNIFLFSFWYLKKVPSSFFLRKIFSEVFLCKSNGAKFYPFQKYWLKQKPSWTILLFSRTFFANKTPKSFIFTRRRIFFVNNLLNLFIFSRRKRILNRVLSFPGIEYFWEQDPNYSFIFSRDRIFLRTKS